MFWETPVGLVDLRLDTIYPTNGRRKSSSSNSYLYHRDPGYPSWHVWGLQADHWAGIPTVDLIFFFISEVCCFFEDWEGIGFHRFQHISFQKSEWYWNLQKPFETRECEAISISWFIIHKLFSFLIYYSLISAKTISTGIVTKGVLW